MCLGGEFKTRSFAIFLLFGQSLWLSRSGGCRGAAKRWVFGTTRSRLSREIAREMGLDFRGFMNCSWRNWLCFLAAEKAPFCLLVGKMCQGWCFLRACPCAPSREGERVLVWEPGAGGAVSWSWCGQCRLSLLCRAPGCMAGPGLLGGFGEASSRTQQETAAGGVSWASCSLGLGTTNFLQVLRTD